VTKEPGEYTVGQGGHYANWEMVARDFSPVEQFTGNVTFRQISNLGIEPYETNPRSVLDYPSTGDGFDRS